jgi:hypothetical protein
VSSRVCPPCERPVNDGYLCHACCKTLKATIEQTPVWADQLALVLARLTRYADPVGSRGAEKPLPYNPAATDPARRLDAALRAAALATGAPKDVARARLGVVAAWLSQHVDDLRKHPDAPMHEAKISKAVEAATKVCDRPPEEWYAGACPDCQHELYAPVTEPTVSCPCGRTWSVEERRAELLAQARDVVAPGPVIARGLSVIGDRPLNEDTLRKWRHRGLLQVQRMTREPQATNWYRVGDVLDLMTRSVRGRRKDG